jgi:hypothetical protein
MSGRYHGLACADRVLAFLVRDGELMGTKVEPRNALPAGIGSRNVSVIVKTGSAHLLRDCNRRKVGPRYHVFLSQNSR